jgi:polyribonucleotide nucleotidyltransferase
MKFETKIGEQKLEVQVDGLAMQASGSCLIKLDDTVILSTCQKGEERKDLDFSPLTCNYEERFYAAGKILGSRYIRRESRPTVEAILISRAVDRGIRPLFPKELKNEVQVVSTCLSWDGKNDPAVLAALGSSIVLSISEIPWQGPVATIRVGRVNEKFILNPSYPQREESELDLLISAVEENEELLINMIELESQQVSEDIVLEAVDFARPFLKRLIDFQKYLTKSAGKEKISIPILSEENSELKKKTKKFLEGKLKSALYQKNKQTRQADLKNLKQEFFEKMKESASEGGNGLLEAIFEKTKTQILRKTILLEEKRPDGRKLDETREISVEVGILPRTHGSGIFTRGETRALSILTLGAPGDQQFMEDMTFSGKKRFLHHYNFPPYSTGEVKPMRGPGRREIGHGMLAEKAILPLLPKFEDFPYAIRVVSEILSSNGSTSMASTSATVLALMDGGVPLERPAAGIAIGLITGEKLSDYKILTDIQGPEDSSGDMDFKVAGTEKGITAIQMDVKIKGINNEILKESLARAKKARFEILKKQEAVISEPRKELAPSAPRIYTLYVNPEKIGAVIGPRGKTINEIVENCGVSIDIEDDGKIFIAGETESATQKAIEWVKNLTREIKIGEIFQGRVVKLFDFGAVVEIFSGQEGLVHISQFVNFHLKSVQDAVQVGDIIPVKIMNIEENGKINLSAKEAGFKPSKVIPH